MNKPVTPRPLAPHRNPAPDMRSKLLEAAIDIFARHGFSGASTRMLAAAAGANQQAIPYYFGGKEGLYLAVADYIADRIQGHVGAVAGHIRSRLATQDTAPGGTPLSLEEAGKLLTDMLKTAARLMVSTESAHWARFIVSEQMEPTEAFERIYIGVMSPLLDTARTLVGALLGEEPASETVRLRTIAMVGQVLILRVAHAAVMRQLDWQEVGARELDIIEEMIERSVAAIVTLRRQEMSP